MTDQEVWELIRRVEIETGYDTFGSLSKLVYPTLSPPPEDCGHE